MGRGCVRLHRGAYDQRRARHDLLETSRANADVLARQARVHPTRGRSHHELYLLCADIKATKRRLAAKGVKFAGKVVDAGWGLLVHVKLPDGSTIGLYEPRHARPAPVTKRKGKKR